MANKAWWHPPVTPRLLMYRQVDPWDSLVIQSSLLRELEAQERLCFKKWSWMTPCRRYWRLSSTLHMQHTHACTTHTHTCIPLYTSQIWKVCVRAPVCMYTGLKAVLLNSPSKRCEKDSCGQGEGTKMKWFGDNSCFKWFLKQKGLSDV